MALAEFFYPSRLKTVVSDLRAQNDLNESVIQKINYYIHVLILLGYILVLIGILVWNLPLDTLTLSFITFGIFLLLIYGTYQIFNVLERFPLLYAIGHKCTGSVERYDVEKYGYDESGHWYLVYKYTVNDRDYMSSTGEMSLFFWDTGHEPQSNVQVYYDPDNPAKSVPATPKLFATFNLKKSLNQDAA